MTDVLSRVCETKLSYIVGDSQPESASGVVVVADWLVGACDAAYIQHEMASLLRGGGSLSLSRSLSAVSRHLIAVAAAAAVSVDSVGASDAAESPSRPSVRPSSRSIYV